MGRKSLVFFEVFLMVAGSLFSQNKSPLLPLSAQLDDGYVLAGNEAAVLVEFSRDVPIVPVYVKDSFKSEASGLVSPALLAPVLTPSPGLWRDARKIGVQFSEVIFLTNGFSTIAWRLVKPEDPFYFSAEQPVALKPTPGDGLSYFPDRTALTSCLSFFSAKVWADYHPHSRLKPIVWAAAAAIPAVTGYLQYGAGKRRASGVLADYAVGAFIGYIVPQLHKVDPNARRKFRISSVFLEGVPVLAIKYRL